MATRSIEYLQSLVRELAKLPDETEWVEFKCNNKQPQVIGEYISALSNSAALCERPKAYLVWGVDDATHRIVGTEFQYRKMKKGNEELEAWLSRMLSPRINFRFFEVPMDEGTVVLMEIPCAEKQPVQFAGGEYIRIGTNKKNLKEYPDKERELWRTFDSTPYELRIAMGNLDEDEMVSLLDYSKYYDKLEMPIPRNRDKVLEDLQHEKFIKKNDAGTWNITNMGALMIAKDLKKFESLHRRTVRVIWYKENSRLDAIREKEFCGGYAFSHEEIVQYIMTIIPQEEIIVDATRKSVVSFPEIAIRELLANAMIHQDLQQRGTNPMVEVFKNRIEFSNAGAPLVAIERIVDSVPVSRNENIAGFMHNSLNAKDLDFFETLPISQSIRFAGMEPVLACHGTPFENQKALLSEDLFVQKCEERYIICGHTHMQGFVSDGKKKIINAGAVGVPLKSPKKTQYMILTSDGKDWKPEFLSLEYDADTVIKEMHESGLWDASPYWCRITEHLLDTGELPHGTVLNHVMKLNDYQDPWYNIADSYWEKALDELGIR